MLWDIFCKVIDNHGDIGVCWRLSAELARRGEQVRLWVDDPASAASGAVCALAWMAPGGQPGVEMRNWSVDTPVYVPGDVVIETFGCEPGEAVVAAIAARSRAQSRQPAWINLEHLSAEPFVEPPPGAEETHWDEGLVRPGLGAPDVPAAVQAMSQRGVVFIDHGAVQPSDKGALTQLYLGGVTFELVVSRPVHDSP